MELIEIKGDLFKVALDNKVDYIGHGANCRSIMGAGIAKQIKKKHPEAYYTDKMNFMDPVQRYGGYSMIKEVENAPYGIINFYTQFNPGPHFDPIACAIAFTKFDMRNPKETTLAIPHIGCGIGGSDIKTLKEIIEMRLRGIKTVYLVEYKK